jgi:NADH:ubiquinone oxidoreductase subunit F (NADH-binding)
LDRAVTGELERLLGPLGERGGKAYAAAVPLLDLVPRSFGEYEAAGGGRGLQAALAAWPVAVIQEIARSGLRGRGGAGFPTGDKWRAVRAVGAGPRYAVCNAAEGEPATFKDRLLVRTNPYQVLEGLAIAAYAVGAEGAYIGLKETFTTELQALTRAVGEIVVGPDLYLFGEETGLEEVIEGRLPLPRVARPFMQGLFARPPADNPTLVNNVETLANVPHILADGPDWLRANGTEAAPGTMVFTICGDVRREGVFELPLGSPLRYLVEELAGGPPGGRAIKAIFPGASNTVIGPAQLDVPLDFDAMRQAGSGLGAGGFAVFDDSAAWCRRPTGTRGFCLWSHAGSARPASSGPARSPKPWRRSRRAADRIGTWNSSWSGHGVHRRAEMRPADRGEPAHAEPGPGVPGRVRQPRREVVSAAPRAPLP